MFIHGWPDTYRLWDSAVRALEGEYRCARFTLPGFEAPTVGRARTLADITALLLTILDKVSPDQPVTLVLHDWGCIFGYELAARHPQRVARIVGVDIGDYNARAYLKSVTGRQKLMILVYQLFLAKAWLVGRFISTALGSALPVKPHCPVLYVYGQRNPFMFHSPRWLEWCNTTPGSKAVGLPCGHWVMVAQPSAFEGLVREWLAHNGSTIAGRGET